MVITSTWNVSCNVYWKIHIKYLCQLLPCCLSCLIPAQCLVPSSSSMERLYGVLHAHCRDSVLNSNQSQPCLVILICLVIRHWSPIRLDAKTLYLCLRWECLKYLGVDVIIEDQLILPWLHFPDISMEGLSDQLESRSDVDQP